jgi:acyl-CoA thioesterase I
MNNITRSLSVIIACALGAAVFAQQKITPMPRISIGKPAFASMDTAHAKNLVDGNLVNVWTGAVNSWVAVKVGSGYSKVLVHWIPYEYSNWIPYWEATDSTGAPGNYQIYVSANSTNGADGTWTMADSALESHYVSRMHTINFAGMQWVKMQMTKTAWANNPIALAELEVFDATNGTEDTWFFMGNSITSGAFHNRITPNFSQVVTSNFPGYTPAMINGGHSGARTTEGMQEIDERLRINPDVHFWCLEYGTNDTRDGYDTILFRNYLDTIITKIMAAGHVPLFAYAPWSAWLGPGTPPYNRAIDYLNAKYHLLPGPDLFTWFKDHPTELKPQDIHPGDVGDASMNRLWAQAAASLYSTTGISQKPASTSPTLQTQRLHIVYNKKGLISFSASGNGTFAVENIKGVRIASGYINKKEMIDLHVHPGLFIIKFFNPGINQSTMVIAR